MAGLIGGGVGVDALLLAGALTAGAVVAGVGAAGAVGGGVGALEDDADAAVGIVDAEGALEFDAAVLSSDGCIQNITHIK